MAAGERGLSGWIVRPGYVLGHSVTAVTNTDDFIWRMVKGCLQLGLIPDINNTVNLVPADHVALLTSLSALTVDPARPFQIAQVTGHPRIRFNDLLGALRTYGYGVTRVPYVEWRTRLEQHVLETQDNALFPLLHFVLDDLPTSTKAAELDDRNARALAKSRGEKEGAGVDVELVGLYVAWLIRAGFLERPEGKGEREVPVIQGGVETAMGRTTAGK
jgi:L-aminoadipate-semialdehyde dehydrogenase